MLRFTRDLVAYARPSSEVPVPVSLHTVIEQALAFCEHVLARARRAGASDSFADGVPAGARHARAARAGVREPVHQRVPRDAATAAAARRHAPSWPTDGQRVAVCVEDNGHGIAADHLAQIFAPFFTTKVDGRGTGPRALDREEHHG